MADKADHQTTSSYKHPSSYFTSVDGVIHFAGLTKEFRGFIKNLPVKEGDLFIATYPKSGIYLQYRVTVLSGKPNTANKSNSFELK